MPFNIVIFSYLFVFINAQYLKNHDLTYEYNALNPFINTDTMKIHHMELTTQYINELDLCLLKLRKDPKTNLLAKRGIDYIILHLDEIDDSQMREKIRRYGGGYVLHDFFWKSLTVPSTNNKPSDSLLHQIEEDFNSMDEFHSIFEKRANDFFGSGWIWLVKKSDSSLDILTTNGNDHVSAENNVKPLFVLDLWEHAYFNQYQNRRNEYVKNWWSVVNWEEASLRFSNSE